MLHKALEVIESFESTVNPDLIRSCIRVYMLKARIDLEEDRSKDALKLYEKCIDMFMREISLIFNQKGSSNSYAVKHKVKVRSSVTMFLIAIINSIKIYQQLDDITRIIELIQLGDWFARRFIEQSSEIYTIFKSFKTLVEKKNNHLFFTRECIIHVLVESCK